MGGGRGRVEVARFGGRAGGRSRTTAESTCSAGVVAELALAPLQLEDHAIVGEQPAALLERCVLATSSPPVVA